MRSGLLLEYSVPLWRKGLKQAPSTYYCRGGRPDNLSLQVGIDEVVRRIPMYGYRRVTVPLRREGTRVKHKRVQRVMCENDLLVVRTSGVRTTPNDHPYGRFPNLLRGLQLVRPDQVWCTAITYIRLREQYVCLAILMAVFARSLRGWYLSRALSSDLALTALQRALPERQPEIHRSDQGVQYAAHGYVAQLQACGTWVSMAARYQPTQNPYAELVMRTIKEEKVYLNKYPDHAAAYREIGHFIEPVYCVPDQAY